VTRDPAILIVDDDPGIQESLEAILTEEGFRVITASDGLDALDKLSREMPGVVLLDLVMPRMDGYAFAEELRSRGLRAQLPIIVLTADGRAEEKASRLQADDHLAKPFDVDELLQKVTRLLGAERPR
jgi:DNA-binding response OmpR family regulator